MKITSERLVESFRKFLKQKEVEEGILDDYTPDSSGRVTVKSILDKIKSSSDNRTWIFFDTETTGLSPEYNQITEVAAIAVKIDMETNNSQIIGEFNKLCDLTTDIKRRVERQKTFIPMDQLGRYDPKYPKVTGLARSKPRTPGGKTYLTKKKPTVGQILDMTNYFKNVKNKTAEVVSEKESLEQLDQFIKSFPSPILIIHNENFDRNFIDVRAGITKASVKTTDYESTDTLEIARAVFCPVVALNKELSEIDTKIKTKKITDKETGKEIEVVSDSPSSTLGTLSKALAIDATRWHTAIADVDMLLKVFDKIVAILKKNESLDISEDYTRIMAKSKSYAKKVKEKADALEAAQVKPFQEPSVSELKESNLSNYWKKRSHKKSDRAKRKRGNKTDREWAKNQQEFSSKINEKVFKLFEKELMSTDETKEEVSSFLKQMKKDRKRKKLRMLEKKKANAIPPLEHPKKMSKRKKPKNPYSGEKKVGKKYPYEGSRNGFKKTLEKRIKKSGGYAIPMGAGYGGASAAMEEATKVARSKKVVKSGKKR